MTVLLEEQRKSLEEQGYELGGKIQEGKDGTVYEAIKDGEKFVIKLQKENKNESYEKILNESYKVLSKLIEYPVDDVVKVHLLNEDLGIRVTKFVEGVELLKFFNVGLAKGHEVSILHKIFQAIANLHKIGIAHHDIKLDNIMIKINGIDIKINDNNDIKINGIVINDINDIKINDNDIKIEVIDLDYSTTNEISNADCGTKMYAAPEILLMQNHIPIKTDIFSLGVLTYIFSILQPPFSFQPNGRDEQIFEGNVTKRQSELFEILTKGEWKVSPYLATKITNTLSFKEADRTSTSQEMADIFGTLAVLKDICYYSKGGKSMEQITEGVIDVLFDCLENEKDKRRTFQMIKIISDRFSELPSSSTRNYFFKKLAEIAEKESKGEIKLTALFFDKMTEKEIEIDIKTKPILDRAIEKELVKIAGMTNQIVKEKLIGETNPILEEAAKRELDKIKSIDFTVFKEIVKNNTYNNRDTFKINIFERNEVNMDCGCERLIKLFDKKISFQEREQQQSAVLMRDANDTATSQ